jgi:hypothetical protein
MVIAGGLVLAGGYLGKYPNAVAAIGCGSGSASGNCPPANADADSIVLVGILLGIAGVAIILLSNLAGGSDSAGSRARR